MFDTLTKDEAGQLLLRLSSAAESSREYGRDLTRWMEATDDRHLRRTYRWEAYDHEDMRAEFRAIAHDLRQSL